MASTVALYTGLSGLTAHARGLEIIGHNIANVNTTAFKATRAIFSPLFSRTIHVGAEPDDALGGTNPLQIGHGVRVGATLRDTSAGALSTTGDARDLAIEGEGFFILEHDDRIVYSRDGTFRTNSNNELINVFGDRVQGFAVDDNFNIVAGQLVDLVIPIGQLTIAQATSQARLAGNLNAAGDVATVGASIQLRGADGEGFSLLDTASQPATPPNALELTSLLVDIEDPAAPGSALFAAGQSLRLDGAEKGTRILPGQSLSIEADTTVADLLTFLAAALGISADAGPNPDGASPGVTLDPATGVITITGNTGQANDLAIDPTDLVLLDAAGTALATPFDVDKSASADGESVRTTFIVFDSLGSAVAVDATAVLEARSDLGTTWRYYIESPDDSDGDLQLTTGTLQFDTAGRLVTTDPVTVAVDRAGSGAATPLTFDLLFGDSAGGVTALADEPSTLAMVEQDGSSPGTLEAYSVAADGTIIGTFSNAITRTLGQIPLALFANAAGLVDVGDGRFAVGANSGEAVIATPGSLGAGSVTSGSLEQSNVDLGQEFINLILTSTGYSASSRVIQATDELLQQLLVLGR